MICAHNMPASVVESSYFKTFCARLNPTFKMPSRKRLVGTCLPRLEDELREQTERRLAAKRDKATISMDGFTTEDGQSYVNVGRAAEG
eukprot:6212314-Prorocentrum_lima.AAC.1